MKLTRDIKYVLGLKVERNRECKKLKLSEERYTKKILERFGILECHPTTCPVTSNAILEVHQGPATNFLYSQAVGLVMYLAMGTRPNMAFNIGLVLRFASNLREVHIKAIKRILPYLLGMTNIDLIFGGSGNHHIEVPFY